MKFSNPSMGGASQEKANPGWYAGRLVGFAYIGTHSGGQWGPTQKVLLRWELSQDGKICVDDKHLVKTVTQEFSATVRGDSNLKKCLLNHGIDIPEDTETDSSAWLGRTAVLYLERLNNFINVTEVHTFESKPEVRPCDAQRLRYENWDMDSNSLPPLWADWKIARSEDLFHRSAKKVKVDGRKPEARETPSSAYSRPAQRDQNQQIEDEEDIPF